MMNFVDVSSIRPDGIPAPNPAEEGRLTKMGSASNLSRMPLPFSLCIDMLLTLGVSAFQRGPSNSLQRTVHLLRIGTLCLMTMGEKSKEGPHPLAWMVRLLPALIGPALTACCFSGF